MQGRLFVISAPSGTGKTTLLRQVTMRLTGLIFSISHTTRVPRPDERDGVA
jgi:guanylate kinase